MLHVICKNSPWHLMTVFCPAADSGSKVRLFMQWVAANFAALPTANAGQYATSHCKPLLFWFPCKRRYMNVESFQWNLTKEGALSQRGKLSLSACSHVDSYRPI